MAFLRSRKIVGITLASALIAFSSLSCASSKHVHKPYVLEERVKDLYKAEIMLHGVMNKLEIFRETGNFNVFYDVEANKRHILGLENTVGIEDVEAKSGIEKFHDVSSIKIDGKEQYNYYNNKCFVVTQLIYNYLQSKNIKSYILYIKNSEGKKILPKDYPMEAVKKGGERIEWAYHTVNAVDFEGEKYVLDPSHSSRAKLLEDYVNRFENPEKLKIHVFEAKRYLEDFMHEKKFFHNQARKS